MIDSGIDATHPELRGPDRRRHLVRRRLLADGQLRPRHVRRRRDRGEPGQRRRDRRHGVQRRAARREGRRQSDCNVSTSGEVKAITLGGRPRRARDQPLDRRRSATRATSSSTRTRRPRRPRSSTRGRRACSSSPRSATARRRPRRPGRTPTTRRRSRTCSASRAIRENGAVPTTRTATRSTSTSPRPAARSSRRSRATSSTRRSTAAPGSPYSNCGPSEFRDGIGTSFAAPQVAAAAALLLGVDPTLTPVPARVDPRADAPPTRAPSTGCPPCPIGRDSLTGWGALDVAAALDRLGNEADLPTADALEPNDDAGTLGLPARGGSRKVDATLDYWDDPVDVYAITLKQGPDAVRPARPRAPGPRTRSSSGARARRTSPARRGRCSQTAPRVGRRRAASSGSPTSRPPTGRTTSRSRPAAPTKAPGRYALSVAAASPAQAPSSSSSGTSRSCRAGLPTTSVRGGDVLRHDRAGADERLLADLDRRAEDRAAADARAAADRRALDQLVPPLGAAHEVVVRRHDARAR